MKTKQNNFMVDDDDDMLAAASLTTGEPMGASLATINADEPFTSTKNLKRDDGGSLLNDDSASNVLFHPPAAHEEHSADSANEDSAMVFGQSPMAESMEAQNAKKADDIDDEATSVSEEPGQGKKKRKKKNKKKKKNQGGADAISEVSRNDQSAIDDSIDDLAREGSQNTRPETNARKLKGQDFTPLKDKIDYSFFDD